MTDNREALVNGFMAGLAPVIEAAMQEQKLSSAQRIADAVESGKGHLILSATLGAGGALHLELEAALPERSVRLLTVKR